MEWKATQPNTATVQPCSQRVYPCCPGGNCSGHQSNCLQGSRDKLFGNKVVLLRHWAM